MAADNSQKNLDRALDLIIYLSKQDEPVTVASLSREMGATRNTTYSMLASLQSRNFVERTYDGRYSIGYGFLELAMGYYHQYPFMHVAEKHMLDLSNQLSLPVSLYVYKSPLNCLRLATTEGHMSLSPLFSGGLIHACTTAPGKLLMAAEPEDAVLADLDERPVEKYTERTITDRSKLLEVVRAHRDGRYAVEIGERFSNMGTVAVPIRNRADKVVGAVSVSIDADMAGEKLDSLIATMELTGFKISGELGNHRNIVS